MTTLTEVNTSADFSKYIYHIDNIYVEERTLLKKVVDRCLSVLRELYYVSIMFKGKVIDYFNPKFDCMEKNKSWLAQSEGLYGLIHGLQGHPAIWQSHINRLKQDTSKDLLVPYVPLRGNGKFEEVTDPILKVFQDYAEKHPKKPICLIGVSNGGRICTMIEAQMRVSHPSTPIKISTIAAVHFGSSRMSFIKLFSEWTGWCLGYHPSVIDDLSFGSNKAKELLEVSQPLTEGVTREFEFFATTEDLNVPEIVSSLPNIGQHQATRHVYHGYGHNSIVEGVAEEQLESCQQWMNSISMTRLQ